MFTLSFLLFLFLVPFYVYRTMYMAFCIFGHLVISVLSRVFLLSCYLLHLFSLCLSVFFIFFLPPLFFLYRWQWPIFKAHNAIKRDYCRLLHACSPQARAKKREVSLSLSFSVCVCVSAGKYNFAKQLYLYSVWLSFSSLQPWHFFLDKPYMKWTCRTAQRQQSWGHI